ncbi:uncharacterized protein LOC132722816 [Ruditapes philippinarum]|uniref:uncharacterized protein LOC132722816 n=1 Tax=Ruditapes philippinarum TaxID=129788 RepID=UPI00295BE04A|nr:uncharacterized protein LOC132722816 [Ruditapes philippinarum]
MAVPGRKADGNLTSMFSDASGEDYDIFCNPCDLNDVRCPAFGFCTNCDEHLCQSCFDKHKQTTSTGSHTLLDSQSMPLTVTPLKTNATHAFHSGLSDDSTVFCSIHKKEPIRFYCYDHEVLVCSLCISHIHDEKSCKVKAISLISKDILDSSEYTESLQAINDLVDRCLKIRNEIKENTLISEKSLETVLNEIQRFKDDLNRKLDDLGKQIENKVKRQKIDHEERLKRAEGLCDDIAKSLKHASDAMKHHKDMKQTDKFFTTLKTSQQLVRVSERKISDLVLADHTEQYHFKPNREIKSCIRNAVTLGTVDYFYQERDICVKTSHDDERCCVSGMTLVSDSKLVILDTNNHSIKLVDLSDNSISYQLKTGGNLSDITTISGDEVAVTVSNEKTILFLTVSSSKLSVKNRFKVDCVCAEITYSNKKLAVTSNDPYPTGYFQIMDLKGKVSSKVKIGNPHSITSDDRYIYVYDSNKDAVNIYDWQGKCISTSRCSDARSLTLLGDGSIYTVSRRNGTLTQVSGDFSDRNIVMKDLASPTKICWSDKSRLLFINRFTSDEKYDNVIKVYKRFVFHFGPEPARVHVLTKKK